MVNETKTAKAPFNRLEMWLAALVGAAVFSVFYPYATHGLFVRDEAWMLKPAFDFVSGLHLFTETFSWHGALTVYIHSIGILLFGKKIVVLHLTNLCFQAGTAAVLFLIARFFIGRFLSFFSVAVWVSFAYFFWPRFFEFVPWNSDFALFFLALTNLLLLLGLERDQRQYLFWSGVSCALVFWCRVPTGLFLVMAISVCFVRLSISKSIGVMSNLFFFTMGNLVCHLIFLGVLIHGQELSAWYHQSVALALFREGKGLGGLPIRILGCLLPYKDQSSFWWIRRGLLFFSSFGLFAAPLANFKRGRYLSCFLLLVCLASLKINHLATAIPLVASAYTLALLTKLRAQSPSETIVMVCGMIAGSSWLQYYPVCEDRHIFWSIAPSISIFLFALKEQLRLRLPVDAKYVRPAVVVMVLLVVFGPWFRWRGMKAVEALRQPWAPGSKNSILEGMHLTDTSFIAAANFLESYGRTHPKTCGLSFGETALYAAFLPNPLNAGPYTNDYQQIKLEGDMKGFLEEREKFIATYKPILIVSQDLADLMAEPALISSQPAGQSANPPNPPVKNPVPFFHPRDLLNYVNHMSSYREPASLNFEMDPNLLREETYFIEKMIKRHGYRRVFVTPAIYACDD